MRQKPSIPFSSTDAVSRRARWTFAVRVALAACLVGALVGVFLLTHRNRGSEAYLQSGRSPVIALDLSWSVSYGKSKHTPADAFERVLGVRPVLVRTGGTLPVMAALAERGIPTILSGFSLPDAAIHSPNERMLVEYFPLGIATARAVFEELRRI